ncbi:RimK family alpha-L-glutamate ligase [Streptomyces coeruleoprunus]|uniref:RimK family alpha-L-glutamate ligase n=1 Tax=Streptomyces coeruleoprunus TaxID=285563 RepID=A0ABV9XB62_9ACTN
MAEHCVLVLTRRGDREATEVASLLRRIGVPVHRLDADGLEGVEATCEPDGPLTLDGHRFVPSVMWLRHFSLRAAPATRPADGQMLYGDSWTALARQLAVVSRATIGATDPGAFRQHAQAGALGVRTPRSVVTTDPAAAAARLPPGRYVVKVLDRHFVEPEPAGFAWFLPRVLERSQLRDALGVPWAHGGTPVVLQEYVDHDAEFRVYLVGGEVLAFEVAKEDPRDVWCRPDRVRVRRAEAPLAVAEAVRALGAAWNLAYGAFDFLLDRGEAVFLEVNAQGDWHWFERRAGVDVVTRAAVRTVRELHRSAVGDRGPGPVDLLTFLGAGRSVGGRKVERP